MQLCLYFQYVKTKNEEVVQALMKLESPYLFVPSLCFLLSRTESWTNMLHYEYFAFWAIFLAHNNCSPEMLLEFPQIINKSHKPSKLSHLGID